jgi:hypothetical protein
LNPAGARSVELEEAAPHAIAAAVAAAEEPDVDVLVVGEAHAPCALLGAVPAAAAAAAAAAGGGAQPRQAAKDVGHEDGAALGGLEHDEGVEQRAHGEEQAVFALLRDGRVGGVGRGRADDLNEAGSSAGQRRDPCRAIGLPLFFAWLCKLEAVPASVATPAEPGRAAVCTVDGCPGALGRLP